MLRVALTGGIGTGKTAVLRRLAELGVPVLDADSVAHAAIAAGTPGAVAVRRRFGDAVMAPDGSVDRAKLGVVVFADARARRDLEAIVHPAVYAAIEAWMADRARDGAAVSVAEIPLLFETGHERDFDRVIVTVCDAEEQVRRVTARGAAEDDARRRIGAQWPLSEKVARAHFVIDTNGTLADTIARTDAVCVRLRGAAAPPGEGPA
jgi:dephospho-CoA kinase